MYFNYFLLHIERRAAMDHEIGTFYPAIPIDEICKKVLRQTTLDIFYLISKERDLSKKDIQMRFKDFDPDENAKYIKYRFPVEAGIASLEGCLFISSWKKGLVERYNLTNYGEVAFEIIKELLNENPTEILLGSTIVAGLMKQLQDDADNREDEVYE